MMSVILRWPKCLVPHVVAFSSELWDSAVVLSCPHKRYLHAPYMHDCLAKFNLGDIGVWLALESDPCPTCKDEYVSGCWSRGKASGEAKRLVILVDKPPEKPAECDERA